MSKGFWENIEIFVIKHGHLVTKLKRQLMREWETLSVEGFKSKGPPLQRCACFVDCTKIRICRLSGEISMDRSC